MKILESNPLFFIVIPTFLLLFSSFSRGNPHVHIPGVVGYYGGHGLGHGHGGDLDHDEWHGGREANGVFGWSTRRFASENVANTTLILAAKRTYRKDPTDDFKRYAGGWNISNNHYWASVAFTAVPLFVIALIWFVFFGLCLSFICLCYCCCPREPYGYSRIAYALSLIFLILFTVAAIIGCVVLYTGQGKFYSSTMDTLDYVVYQANTTGEKLNNVSDSLAAAKRVTVGRVVLPTNIQTEIDSIEAKIVSSAANLEHRTSDNSRKIKDVLNAVRLALVIIAAVMLLLAFLGFLFSIFGMQFLVYPLVILGWILVAGTFVLCGIFLLLHNVTADTCVAMDEWVQHPTAYTALDDILPCVDNATAQETLLRTKDVTFQLASVINTIISNVTNINFPPGSGPVYFNQSGPLMPTLCSPFNSDLTDRQCASGEVDLDHATQVWKTYVCEVSSSGICATQGRMTPTFYNQMLVAVRVCFSLYHNGPFLVDLQDCNYVRQTFTEVSRTYCPGLRRYSGWIHIGLEMVSTAVMLSLIFWVIYARERRHRVYTKDFISKSPRAHVDLDKDHL